MNHLTKSTTLTLFYLIESKPQESWEQPKTSGIKFLGLLLWWI